MEAYAWPGNVRELQNFVQRAVILSPGRTLRAPLEELPVCVAGVAAAAETAAEPGQLTLQEIERRHILKVLELTRWRVGGRRGAAAFLGVSRTTLQSKMKKLGIHRQPRSR